MFSLRSFYSIVVVALLFTSCQSVQKQSATNGALEALQMFADQRAYPNDNLPKSSYYDAFEYVQTNFKQTSQLRGSNSEWEAIGPWNTAGRMLALAIHPDQPSVIWAGSASGGLWKTEEFGVDTSWERVPTGYPVNGVSAVALSPNDADVILIGTGEVYNLERSGDGAAYRSTRGTPGIGLLRSEDGGVSWELAIDWTRDQNQGVNHIAFDPVNPDLAFAATTDGIYKSIDNGKSWSKKLDVAMATDIDVSPSNPNQIIAGCGNFDTDKKGIYYSSDGGETWLVSGGDIPDFHGKIRLTFSQNDPGVAYASIGDGFSPSDTTATWTLRTANFGQTWTEVSTVDYSRWQGWFAHDIAVDPNDSDIFIGIGIYIHKSKNAGVDVRQVTMNPQVTKGQPPVAGPDGPEDYTHVDHHTVIYHPSHHDTVLVACDGGVFFSSNGGETWQSRNGGLQTVQFYNGIAIDPSREDWILGGMQDNHSIHFDGNFAWTRKLGGDGSWAAIDPRDPDVFFASFQWLNVFKSRNRGQQWQKVLGTETFENPAFIAPYVMHPSTPDVMYAASNYVKLSGDAGESWSFTNNNQPINGNNPIISMDVAPSDLGVVYVGTAPFDSASSVWLTDNAGDSWAQVGEDVLPDRYPMDIAVDPNDAGRAVVVYSGYGSGHVFLTENFGKDWEDITANLPDLPTQAVAIDGKNRHQIYIGNDIGVFYSINSGKTWHMMDEGMPETVIVNDLKISNTTEKIVAATHGNGMYISDLIDPLTTSHDDIATHDWLVYPTLISTESTLNFTPSSKSVISISWYNLGGQFLFQEKINAGQNQFRVPELSTGNYFIRMEDEKGHHINIQQVIKQ